MTRFGDEAPASRMAEDGFATSSFSTPASADTRNSLLVFESTISLGPASRDSSLVSSGLGFRRRPRAS